MELNFENKFIAFIDVLGFSELVKFNNRDKLSLYFKTVKSALEVIGNNKPNIIKLQISDSIILIAEDTQDDFNSLLQAIRYIQQYLSWNDIWVRGGIAFGEVCYKPNESIIVGKGFIDAYNIEKEAIYPRVIISPNIIQKMGDNLRKFTWTFNGPHNNENELKLIHNTANGIRVIPDDAIFVCYAHKTIIDSIKETNQNYSDSKLKQVFSHIKNNLYSEQSHYHKYLWLSKYFNETLCAINYSKYENRKEWYNQAIIDFGSL